MQTAWPHFVRVTVASTYNDSLGGLCGNNNGHLHDDFRTPNGVLVNNAQVFGDSWRDGSLSAHCVERTNEVPETNSTNDNTSDRCSVLVSPGGPFAACLNSSDHRELIESCIHSATGNPATLCGFLQSYALICQNKGFAVGPWRNITGCGK